MGERKPDGLQRHFGLLQATALNITMIVGAGVFGVIPAMLGKLDGGYALLAWIAVGALILLDGMTWSELGASIPGSGGSYLYLLEGYGRARWGRLMAFLFIWQFLISGPLEIASGLILMGKFSYALHPALQRFNGNWSYLLKFASWEEGKELIVGVGPVQIGAALLGVLMILLLYRRITTLGKLTVTFWAGVLLAIAWILVEGALRFNAERAFDFSTLQAPLSSVKGLENLGAAMILALYSYLGYYHICYIGDEVRDPGRTIPRAIFLSAVAVCLLFVGVHLALLGTLPWREVKEMDSPAAEFMRRIHGDWAATLITLLIIWSCFGSAFAGLLGYSRIPYGAARYGHFFAALGAVHPVHRIPHIALFLVGGLTLFWSFFDLESVINALIVTRILEQFIGQIGAVMLLRRNQPDRPRPYRIWLYPLPCGLALCGWLFVYVAAGWQYVVLGLATLGAGLIAFFIWARWKRDWPFGAAATQ